MTISRKLRSKFENTSTLLEELLMRSRSSNAKEIKQQFQKYKLSPVLQIITQAQRFFSQNKKKN